MINRQGLIQDLEFDWRRLGHIERLAGDEHIVEFDRGRGSSRDRLLAGARRIRTRGRPHKQ